MVNSSFRNWTDSHCHLGAPDDARAVLDRAVDAGVTRFVDVGTDLATSRAACALAAADARVHATVGLHPHDAFRLDDEWDALVELASTPRVVAIGEAGFDLYYEHSPRDAQERAFRRQIALANDLDLPLVIHTRDAWDDTFRVLESEGVPRRLVFHCFTGGPAEAERAVAIGAHCSFSGIVSFKNADDVRAAAVVVPDDRLLVETDAPYLAPVPMRGRENESAYLPYVGAALANARGSDDATIGARTAANAAAVFGLAP